MNTVTGVSDTHLLDLITATIPVMEDLRAIMGNWNGDEPGFEEEQAYLASEIFEKLAKLAPMIKQLNGEE